MSILTVALLLLASLLALFARRTWRRGLGRRLAVLSLGALGLSGLALALGTYSLRYHHRPQPAEIRRELFRGVRYHREPLRRPRPLVAHWVEIDLTAPGVDVLVTPPEPTGGRQLAARTVRDFLERQGVQLAVNGGYFQPWFSKGPLWYYPHVGDPVDPIGLAVSSGQVYGPPEGRTIALFSTSGGRVGIERMRKGGTALSEMDMAVAGTHLLLDDGRLSGDMRRCVSTCLDLHPRTAAALDRTGERLLLGVIDGRQPGYSEGVGLSELAELLLRRGWYRALNLDGGGSSTLVVQGRDRRGRVLSSPIHGRIPPGRERPVATHIGITAHLR